MAQPEFVPMRFFVLALALLVIVFVAVTAWGTHTHASTTSSKGDRPDVSSWLAAAWPLVPGSLKIGRSDITVSPVQSNSGPLVIQPGAIAYVRFNASSQAYRLMRLTLANGSNATVALQYPSVANPPPSGTPEPLSPAKPQQTVVLSQSGGYVILTCAPGGGPCSVSL